FELLNRLCSNHPKLALLTNCARPWVEKRLKEDGRLSKSDKIMSNYRRLCRETGIYKPMKLIRKTSANLLESHRDHAKFARSDICYGVLLVVWYGFAFY